MEKSKKKSRGYSQKVKYVKKSEIKHEISTELKSPKEIAKFSPTNSPKSFPATFYFSEEEFNKQFAGSMEYSDVKDPYFSCYSHFAIHEEMLKDEIRTKSYMLACLCNKEQFKDKIVLDIGCGTGILSIFAIKAGAKHVYGIDNAEIADFAKYIVKANGLEEKITIIKGKMEEIELPVDQVDIIISEWMGYFLLYENMLDTVIFARDRYLKPGGLLLPNRVTLNLAAIEDSQYRIRKFQFWDNVYGVNMECMKKVSLSEPHIDIVESAQILSNECKILDLNLYTVKSNDLEFANKYTFQIQKTDTIHAIVGWFDAYFENLKEPIKLTTSPYCKPTHWKQAIFYLNEPIQAKETHEMYGSIAVRKALKNSRDLDIKISFHYNDEELTIGFSQMYKLR